MKWTRLLNAVSANKEAIPVPQGGQRAIYIRNKVAWVLLSNRRFQGARVLKRRPRKMEALLR